MASKRTKTGHFHQGIFEPQNKKKYLCKRKYAYFRSGWEREFMKYLDESKHVKGWCSECVRIPYVHNGRKTLYYPDFLVVMNSGITKLIEVKPLRQTKPPRKDKRKKVSTLLEETETYRRNLAKWNAAKKFCEARNWEFQILTEKTLTI